MCRSSLEFADFEFREVLDGVGVDGVGGNFPVFFVFPRFLHFSSLFFSFPPFFFLCFSSHSPGTRASKCNLLEKRGISLQPRLHWLRVGPPFHGSRSSREIKIQNASCRQMGGRGVTGR